MDRTKISAHYLQYILLGLLTLCLIGCGQSSSAPIKVGILHAQTGPMAISEKPVIDATLMAIKELNESGGLLGREIQPIIMDTESSAEKAEVSVTTLIVKDKVQAIFGCWTSSCRKAVKPIFETHNHLLFYPVQYEGLERSSNIIYLGSVPNQQIMPTIKWITEHLGKRMLLVSSNYVFPKVANRLMKKQIKVLGGSIAGEEYYLLGESDFSGLLTEIERSKPRVIINTLNGDSNVAFFEMLARHNISIPVMSFSASEGELQAVKLSKQNQIYSAKSYFQSIDLESNRTFLASIKKLYGDHVIVSDAMVSAYNGVHLWAKTVRRFKTLDPSSIRQALKGESFDGPIGITRISMLNSHAWNPLYIAKADDSGVFEVVESYPDLIRPLAFPSYESRQYWNQYLNQLYLSWQERWSAGNKERPEP